LVHELHLGGRTFLDLLGLFIVLQQFHVQLLYLILPLRGPLPILEPRLIHVLRTKDQVALVVVVRDHLWRLLDRPHWREIHVNLPVHPLIFEAWRTFTELLVERELARKLLERRIKFVID